MIKIELINNNSFPFAKLKDFLCVMDCEYPISLSSKVSFDVFLDKIKEKGSVLCAIDNDRIVGALFFYANNFTEKIAFITLFGVVKEYRRKGIASMLFDKMVYKCKRDFEKIQLYTHSTNVAAISFYKNKGFYSIPCDRDGDLKLELLLNKEKNINILLTSVGRRSYLVKYFKEALDDIGEVHVSNSSDISPAFLVADKSIVSPLIYDDKYIPFLLNYCKKNNINIIISLFDIDLYKLALNKDLFAKNGIRVIVSDADFVKICNDKWLTYLFLKENGFHVPRTYLNLNDVKDDLNKNNISYPIMLKPRWGMGSLSNYVVNNDMELNVLYQKIKNEIQNSYMKYESLQDMEHSVLIQELLSGQEYGLDVINDLEGNYINTIVKKKIAMRSGETDCAEVLFNKNIKKVGQKLGKLTKHIANLDVDVFYDGKKVYILEMNARFGGGYPFSHMAGVNLPKAIINWCDNKEVDFEMLEIHDELLAHKDIDIVKLK